MKFFVIFLITVYCLLITSNLAFAKFDPTTTPNNKVGVHILSPSEVGEAAKLVNSNGGDWGYVTVPIQPTERDQVKWNKFMEDCQQLHLIPIIRITTIPFGGTWTEGRDTDLVDFANFLSGLNWPTGNRYVVVFNEVNRSEEWGDTVDPVAYAKILKNASIIFKERSEDFFILAPALDSALPDSKTSLSAQKYLQAMAIYDPNIWSYIDGWASHSYPNPAFSASPSKKGWQSIVSYHTETSFLKIGNKPVFITETGWNTLLPASTISSYWRQAFNIWNQDKTVVAVTPFILSGGAQFASLSLIDSSGNPTASYLAIRDLAKVAGSPGNDKVMGTKNITSDTSSTSQSSDLAYNPNVFLLRIENFFRSLFGLLPRGYLSVNSNVISVELARSAKDWEHGLSGRPSLEADSGMLFIFPKKHLPAFWMKDMQFSIDIVWIDGTKVVGVESQVPVQNDNNNLPTYSPSVPVDKVLELPSGYAKTYNIEPGTIITYY